MTPPPGAWTRRFVAAAVGGVLAGGFAEFVANPALETVGRGWELGAVPFLFAETFFAPVLAAMVAGLIQPDRPYLGALLAQAALAAFAIGFTELNRNAGVTFIAATPFAVPLTLWGALLVDARLGGRARRLRPLRDGTYPLAYFLALFALLPSALRWLPAPLGFLAAVVAPAAFFVGLSVRNRRAAQSAGGEEADGRAPRSVKPPDPWTIR